MKAKKEYVRRHCHCIGEQQQDRVARPFRVGSADAVLQGNTLPDDLAQCTEAAQAILGALQQEIPPPDSIDICIMATYPLKK
jgi:hypothetical protein